MEYSVPVLLNDFVSLIALLASLRGLIHDSLLARALHLTKGVVKGSVQRDRMLLVGGLWVILFFVQKVIYPLNRLYLLCQMPQKFFTIFFACVL